MSLGILVLVLVVILLATAGFIWYMGRDQKRHRSHSNQKKSDDLLNNATKDVEHIFNDEFRQELRNRGRLHFEKIIGENAMFLQQDLRLTTSQLNEFMKQEITKTLQQEFSKYQQSIDDAKQLAIESLQKTQNTVEEQRKLLTAQLQEQLAAEKSRRLASFEKNLAEVINHYVLAAIGDQIDLSDQLEYIIGQIDANKKAIIEDLGDGE